MEEKVKKLKALLGGHFFAAEVLGYTDRQYRNIRRKIRQGEDLNPRIGSLISLKLKEIEGCPRQTK